MAPRDDVCGRCGRGEFGALPDRGGAVDTQALLFERVMETLRSHESLREAGHGSDGSRRALGGHELSARLSAQRRLLEAELETERDAGKRAMLEYAAALVTRQVGGGAGAESERAGDEGSDLGRRAG